MPKRKPSRRNYTSEQKAAIVRRHLADKVPVSDLCDEYKLQPSVFYNWLRVALQKLQGVSTGVTFRLKQNTTAARLSP